MDVFTINFHQDGKFIQNGATWSYVGGSISYLDVFNLDTFSYFDQERDVKIIYASIKMIAYLKPRMGFSEGITFFNDDHGFWDMLKCVREGKIDVYYERVREKGIDNVNEMVESEDVNAEMDGECSVVGGGYDEEDVESLQLEGESLHEREDNEGRGKALLSIDEENAANNDIDSDGPLSQYNYIDDDGAMTPSSTDEDELFVEERKRKIRQDVYDPRVDLATFKFKEMQKVKDVAECKGPVRKWAIINRYNLNWVKSTSKQLDARC